MSNDERFLRDTGVRAKNDDAGGRSDRTKLHHDILLKSSMTILLTI